MKKLACLIMACALMGSYCHAEIASTDNTYQQLTVELRDGSRVVGKAEGQTLNFHSDTVGDMKLPWTSIRSVDYADKSETALLSATNGDQFSVKLSIDALQLNSAFGKIVLPAKLIRSVKVSPASKQKSCATGSVDGHKLVATIELRDGSRLVGKGLNDNLNFHSAAMGDLKLTWADIRSIECPIAVTDPARLTARNGDIYEALIVTPKIQLETSFGKAEVDVKLARKIYVSIEGDYEENLLGWWKLDEGEGTVAKDSSSIDSPHDGNLVNGPVWTKSTDGQWSLQFNGSNQYVSLGNILQDGYQEISISCWVKHAKDGFQEFIERGVWDNSDGIGLVMDNSDNPSVIFGHYGTNVRSKGSVQDDKWHQVVGTMSKNDSGYVYSIYIDGKLDNKATGSMGLTASTSNWSIGARDGGGSWAYKGQIEDVRIYNRALLSEEVETIYLEQNHDNDQPESPAPVGPTQPVKPSGGPKPVQGNPDVILEGLTQHGIHA